MLFTHLKYLGFGTAILLGTTGFFIALGGLVYNWPVLSATLFLLMLAYLLGKAILDP